MNVEFALEDTVGVYMSFIATLVACIVVPGPIIWYNYKAQWLPSHVVLRQPGSSHWADGVCRWGRERPIRNTALW